ncbi:MAG: hypothetical protein AB1830_07720 [Pseudomonadota bacterium]
MTPIERIELLKPHTHAGRDYPAGAVLDLARVGLDQDSAAWLVSIGAARVIPGAPKPKKGG